jgi:hypothetical protein
MSALQQSRKLHLLTISVFTSAVFLPMIGKGFIHDDFVHLFSASHDSLATGLTTAADGPFYAPIAWLTFRLDWQLWGVKPFPMAVQNLLLHIVNMFLIYAFTVRLWGSKVGGFWAAFGFGLILPANVWATMWISTRAHLLATAFYVAALITTLRFLRTGKLVNATAALAMSFLAIFSKESAVTLPAALAWLAICEKRTEPRKTIPALGMTLLIAAVLGVVAVYLTLRARSGAVPFSFNVEGTYSYASSLSILWSNLLEYSWRTFGMLIIIGGALAFSRYLSGRKLRFNLLTRNEVVFSIVLCAIMISPFMLLFFRSGIYTYLPEAASAVLLGAAARSFYQPDDNDAARSRPAALVPVLLVVATFTIFMVGQSQRWMTEAKTTTVVLNQISEQVTRPEPNTYFVLKYTAPDRANRFPNGFATWAFPAALRLHYADPSLNGTIVLADASDTPPAGSPRINLLYTSEPGKIKVVKVAED